MGWFSSSNRLGLGNELTFVHWNGLSMPLSHFRCYKSKQEYNARILFDYVITAIRVLYCTSCDSNPPLYATKDD